MQINGARAVNSWPQIKSKAYAIMQISTLGKAIKILAITVMCKYGIITIYSYELTFKFYTSYTITSKILETKTKYLFEPSVICLLTLVTRNCLQQVCILCSKKKWWLHRYYNHLHKCLFYSIGRYKKISVFIWIEQFVRQLYLKVVRSDQFLQRL